MKRAKPPYSLTQSFYFAFRGIAYAVRHERNLRIHFSAMVYVLYFAVRYYDFNNTQYALLLIVIGFVITCEMINTAIEKTVDIETPVYHGLAKIAKDVAAGAVFISAATSIAVSLLLFWDTDVFAVIAADAAIKWPVWGLMLVITVIWVIFPRKTKKY